MADRSTSRIDAVLRIARRREKGATIDKTHADRALKSSSSGVDAATERLHAVANAGGSVAEFQRQNNVSNLRAQQVLSAEEAHRERLTEAVAARAALLDTVRRRRSLEKVDERDQKVRAVIAAQAAQRALDELGSPRRESRRGSEI